MAVANVNRIYMSASCVQASINLPDLTTHLACFAEEVIQIVNQTNYLVSEIKECSEVRRMSCVNHAFSEINYFIAKAYEYISKINEVPYYFHCNFNGESGWTAFENCKIRFEKGEKCLRECLEIYETLKSYCRDAQRSCDSAASKLSQEAESARKKKIAARTTGAVATAAGVGTGVTLSLIAGIFTLGIGTVVGLATTAGVATAAGVGTGIAGAVVGEHYNKSSDNFRQLSRNFLRLSDHAVALSDISRNMISTLSQFSYHLSYAEAHLLLETVQENGRASYTITCAKRQAVLQRKESLTSAINSV